MKKVIVFASLLMLFACKDKPVQNAETVIYEDEMEMPAEAVADAPDPAAEAALAASGLDPALVEKGKALFSGKGTCIACHQPAEKTIGPSITEIGTIYKKEGASLVAFLKDDAKPIVDPAQYVVMQANLAITKKMSADELASLEAYMLSMAK
ncbi:c-type cytochrome [Flavobacterium ardleyense]|uniref:c-type cytochrome n=1 Tax=Flavobacterium ardleyense TaxID=2038737 RepID=UPI00298BDE08|nr:c-type cytochrome [Flavobacterium ardleyense]